MLAQATGSFYQPREIYLEKRERILNNYDFRTEYRAGNDIFCRKCHKPKTFHEPARNFIVRCSCDCDRAAWEEERAAQTRRLREERFAESKARLTDLGRSYENARFSCIDFQTAEDSYVTAIERCERFCANFDVACRSGRGLWLFGDKGVGKAHFGACILHKLEDDGRTAIFTSANKIISEVMATYKSQSVSESAVVKPLVSCECLIINNLDEVVSTSRKTETFAQRKLAEILRARLEDNRPTVIISRTEIEPFGEREIFPDDVIDLLMSKQVQLRLVGPNRRLR